MYKTPQQTYKKLINSKEFQNKGFLSGFFISSTPENFHNEDWQIHFYEKDSDKMVTYVVGEKIIFLGESDIFKEKNEEVEELNLDKIKIDLDSVIKKCEFLLKNHNEIATKIIIILQNHKVPIWNITYVTERFNMVNIKINAENGELIDDNVISLLSFGKVDGTGLGVQA